jgi:hypothetical protein
MDYIGPMIWADRFAIGALALLTALMLFFYAHGDLEGLRGLYLSVIWGALYIVLPTWLVLRAIDFMLFGVRRA